MKITWLGHSCFKIESNGYSIITDPFEDGYVPGFDNIRGSANEVLCSHYHNDHGAKECVTLIKRAASPFTIEVLDTFHDDKQGTLRGENVIHIISDGIVKIAHFGDLGCMLTKEQLEKLKNLDAVLIPVGGFYTIDANEAKNIVNLIAPKVVIPMHYKSDSFGFDVLATADDYASLCDDVVYYDTNSIEISTGSEKQTAILKYI